MAKIQHVYPHNYGPGGASFNCCPDAWGEQETVTTFEVPAGEKVPMPELTVSVEDVRAIFVGHPLMKTCFAWTDSMGYPLPVEALGQFVLYNSHDVDVTATVSILHD